MKNILEEIMSALKKEACSEGMLADKLGVSTAELQACLKYLEAMGYIHKSTFGGTESKECEGDSSDCAHCKGCCSSPFSNTQDVFIWELT